MKIDNRKFEAHLRECDHDHCINCGNCLGDWGDGRIKCEECRISKVEIDNTDPTDSGHYYSGMEI